MLEMDCLCCFLSWLQYEKVSISSCLKNILLRVLDTEWLLGDEQWSWDQQDQDLTFETELETKIF